MTDVAKRAMTATEAHQLTSRIQLGIENLDAALREAIEGNVHEALGYPTLTDWWMEEVGSARLSGELRDRWIKQIRLDHPQKSQRAIAAAVGADQATVSRTLNPPSDADASPAKTPGPTDAATETPPADPGTAPASEVESPAQAAPREPDPTPEQYKADLAERIAAVAPEPARPAEPDPAAPPPPVQVEVGRRSAETIVQLVMVEVVAIIAAVDLGEDLITEQMVDDLQGAIDLLASRCEGIAA